jgi:hypothetical protein
MGRRSDRLPRNSETVRMRKQPPLSRVDLEAFHSVLRRAAERAEAEKRTEDAVRLAAELALLDAELAVTR